MMHRFFPIIFLVLSLSCVTPPQRPSEPPEVLPEFDSTLPDYQGKWWNDEVFYEIYVRSFQDSDGDGNGDLQGVIQRMDYLKDLGVTALWLMPIFEADSQHGYDTLDYRAIEKDYGTMEDFKELLDEAHSRDIKVILDLVLNHSSNHHPWFEAALEDPFGPAGDFYLFREGPEGGYWREVEGSDPAISYYGWFNPTMPDLNYLNPEVSQEMLDVTRFWLGEVGVDGYRLDAIKYLIEEGEKDQNTQSTHQWLKGFFNTVKEANPMGFTVGEVWDSLETILSYTGDEMDVNFHFPLSSAIADSLEDLDPFELFYSIKNTLEVFPPGQYATFLRNHDQNRLMREFDGDAAKSLQAAVILLTLPGVPFLYYGEEIGLSLNRKAMQWEEEEPHFGFSTRRPFSNGTQEGGDGLSVSAQTGVPGSMLESYRNLISLRKENSSLRTGKTILLESGHDAVLAYLRWDGENSHVIVHNFSELPIADYGLTLWGGPYQEGISAQLIYPEGNLDNPNNASEIPTSGGFHHWQPMRTLEPNGSYIIGLGN